MTISERKEAYAQQFENLTQQINQLNDELQKAITAREQVRGRYGLAVELEQEERATKAQAHTPQQADQSTPA